MREPTLYLGDCLEVMRSLPAGSVDAVITDPPYSSGGLMRGDRTPPTITKYTGGKSVYDNFSGDNRDQRSWLLWSIMWIEECRRVLREGGYFLTFIDWRQLPTMSDAVQVAGLIWRGVTVWDKGRSARAPHTGYFRHQCEYIVWGSNGVLNKASGRGPFDGCYSIPVRLADKHHITGKPTVLMNELVRVAPPGGAVLDPFMGSGTTGVACANTGREFIGVELDHGYYDIAALRIKEAYQKAAAEVTL